MFGVIKQQQQEQQVVVIHGAENLREAAAAANVIYSGHFNLYEFRGGAPPFFPIFIEEEDS